MALQGNPNPKSGHMHRGAEEKKGREGKQREF